ncbi:MAG: spondin domain-containing protein, partial [Aeoliella sp.]
MKSLSGKMSAASLAAMISLTFSGAALSAEATYEATFESLWNGDDHPRNFPSSAHFSPLVGASHAAGVNFWMAGDVATPGVESVAETGATGSFVNEVNAAVGRGDALQSITGTSSVFVGGTTTSNVFEVNSSYPLVTFLSMIAPSPDWFVGIHDYDLRDGAGFAESRVFDFDTFYDAGTEEGSGFSTSNPATNPIDDISLVAGDDARDVFIPSSPPGPGPRGQSELQPIARLTLTRLSQTVPEPGSIGLAMAGLLSLLGVRQITRRRLSR